RLGRHDQTMPGIMWPKTKENSPLVFQHGVWLIGFRDGKLIGTAPMWDVNYTPGPIIDQTAAVVVDPADSARYRTYIVTRASTPADADWKEWPVSWGAPVAEDGSPKLAGDVNCWTVYNDAHPQVHGQIERASDSADNTMIEIRESIWGYNQPGLSGDILFFKWQIFNQSDRQLDSLVFCHWNDIDLSSFGDQAAFDAMHGYGYVYSPRAGEVSTFSRAASFVLLQGPIIPQRGGSAFAFGREIEDYNHLPVTAFWGITDDSVPPHFYGGFPETLSQAYFFITGRRHDGSLIRNPETGEPTPFTFSGDPASNAGWLMSGTGGGCGYLSASGPFTLAAGDSQEVVYALVPADGGALSETLSRLHARVDQVQRFYQHGEPIDIPEVETPSAGLTLEQNYPNPFGAETSIRFDLSCESPVHLAIYSVRGEHIARYNLGILSSGSHAYVLDNSILNLSSGLYFIRIDACQGFAVTKMICVL
ncbi:MAG: T9SS C-terminal target domain-containing protein, partial [Calditrichaeota bacterium]